MLTRHIIGYLPSLLIPALTAFGAIYCYTRLLGPHEYGVYILLFNSMAFVNVLCFYWLQVSLPRLMPEAMREGAERELFTTAISAFSAVGFGLILCTALYNLCFPASTFAPYSYYVIALALLRALLSLHLTRYRSRLNFTRYNILECGQSLLGLTFSLLFIYVFHAGVKGALIGMMLGYTSMLVMESKTLAQVSPRYFSRKLLRALLRFGLPLVITYGFAFILSTSDRFLIEHFYGAALVGQYAAGYSLADRIITHVFMIVTLPAFALAVAAFETGEHATARAQMHINFIAVLALALPACAGLIRASPILATLLLGTEFRETATHIMPWIAVAALLNGLATHYFDHAFHLAKKPYLLLFTQGPAAAVNVALNFWLLPRIGIMGAIWATLAAYALQLMLSILIGRHAFISRFPFKEALQITLATLLMAAVLGCCHFSAGITGLITLIITGVLVYTGSLYVLNINGIRGKLKRLP